MKNIVIANHDGKFWQGGPKYDFPVQSRWNALLPNSLFEMGLPKTDIMSLKLPNYKVLFSRPGASGKLCLKVFKRIIIKGLCIIAN